MIVKAKNPSQVKIGKDLINISMDIVIYAADGTTELHRERISANANTHSNKKDTNGVLKWRKHVVKHLIREEKRVVDEFNKLNSAIVSAYPDAKDADDALMAMAQEVQDGLKAQ